MRGSHAPDEETRELAVSRGLEDQVQLSLAGKAPSCQTIHGPPIGVEDPGAVQRIEATKEGGEVEPDRPSGSLVPVDQAYADPLHIRHDDGVHGACQRARFLFLCVGVWWVMQAFLTKAVNQLWWLGLTAGILMIILGFWTSGQFFLQRAYTLLVFAGIWAMMHGVTDIIRAFQIRSLRENA